MRTLLLRLAAPLQAWGLDSKFDMRQTEREPTKSGVLGLVACAMGIRRDDAKGLLRLQGLSFGVRVEQEGKLLRDYHIAKSYKMSDKSGLVKLDGRTGRPTIDKPYLTQRYYLADAVFLAALSGEDALIAEIAEALGHPAFPLYLGRRSCPPTLPILLGVTDAPVETVLRETPWQAAAWYQQDWRHRHPGEGIRLRWMMDAPSGEASHAMRRDVPASWAHTHRRYAYRNATAGMAQMALLDTTAHDALAEVESCTSVE